MFTQYQFDSYSTESVPTFEPVSFDLIILPHSLRSPCLSSGPKMNKMLGKKTTADKKLARIVVMKRIPN
jgi:hypothetical protein